MARRRYQSAFTPSNFSMMGNTNSSPDRFSCGRARALLTRVASGSREMEKQLESSMVDLASAAREVGIKPIPLKERPLGLFNTFVLWADPDISFLVMRGGYPWTRMRAGRGARLHPRRHAYRHLSTVVGSVSGRRSRRAPARGYSASARWALRGSCSTLLGWAVSRRLTAQGCDRPGKPQGLSHLFLHPDQRSQTRGQIVEP